MRLPVETFADHFRRIGLALILPAVLAGCSAAGGAPASFQTAALPNTGPAADYPVVVGEPYRVGDRLYTPVDTLNYDEVGYVAADAGAGITASNHTLPLPSYAEVTSLNTGRTILVRVERRGPLDSHAVVALSPAALEQLGANAGEPVRVRRVNPPEEERAFLRAGRSAPLRMDTPAALLTALKRKLPENGSILLVGSNTPATLAQVDIPASKAGQQPTDAEIAPETAPLPVPEGDAVRPATAARTEQPRPQADQAVAQQGRYVVQAVALSSRDRAQRVASEIGGTVTQAGKLYRVRTGPFATRSQAEASLAKVRAAGYSEARIFTNS